MTWFTILCLYIVGGCLVTNYITSTPNNGLPRRLQDWDRGDLCGFLLVFILWPLGLIFYLCYTHHNGELKNDALTVWDKLKDFWTPQLKFRRVFYLALLAATIWTHFFQYPSYLTLLLSGLMCLYFVTTESVVTKLRANLNAKIGKVHTDRLQLIDHKYTIMHQAQKLRTFTQTNKLTPAQVDQLLTISDDLNEVELRIHGVIHNKTI